MAWMYRKPGRFFRKRYGGERTGRLHTNLDLIFQEMTDGACILFLIGRP